MRNKVIKNLIRILIFALAIIFFNTISANAWTEYDIQQIINGLPEELRTNTYSNDINYLRGILIDAYTEVEGSAGNNGIKDGDTELDAYSYIQESQFFCAKFHATYPARTVESLNQAKANFETAYSNAKANYESKLNAYYNVPSTAPSSAKINAGKECINAYGKWQALDIKKVNNFYDSGTKMGYRLTTGYVRIAEGVGDTVAGDPGVKTKETAYALAYANGKHNITGKQQYETIQDWKDDNYGDNDVNNQVIWNILEDSRSSDYRKQA